MDAKSTIKILEFYRDIDDELKELHRREAEISDVYNTVSGINMDGMPHGSAPGSPVENAAITAAYTDAGTRLSIIARRRDFLQVSRRVIEAQMERLNFRHKMILGDFYVRGRSWAQISLKMGYSDRQCKNIRGEALAKLGEYLDEQPETAKILAAL